MHHRQCPLGMTFSPTCPLNDHYVAFLAMRGIPQMGFSVFTRGGACHKGEYRVEIAHERVVLRAMRDEVCRGHEGL
jgi:hypothetical protein